jgi:hypothetical protein
MVTIDSFGKGKSSSGPIRNYSHTHFLGHSVPRKAATPPASRCRLQRETNL